MVYIMKSLLVVLLFSASLAGHAAPSGVSEETPLTGDALIQQIGDHFQQTRDFVSERATSLIVNAMGLLGVPYKYGGTSAETGFDCSGFVRTVFEESVGKVLPRRAEEQAAVSQVIEHNELKPGDLVFFNTMRRAFSHVGIYIGDGKFIHSPRKGSKVRIEDMRQAYWQKRFNGARRVNLTQQNTDLAKGTAAN